jgi:hypothetical protein
LAEVHQLREPRREYISDGARSALRATWHRDSGFVVLSLWRGDTCVATSHLTPGEAGRLAIFITRGLADLAAERSDWSETQGEPALGWRGRAARSLEWIAGRLR